VSKFLDLENPFFAPLWIRIAVTCVLISWGGLEISQGAYAWAVIFIGLGLICGWRFANIDYSALGDE